MEHEAKERTKFSVTGSALVNGEFFVFPEAVVSAFQRTKTDLILIDIQEVHEVVNDLVDFFTAGYPKCDIVVELLMKHVAAKAVESHYSLIREIEVIPVREMLPDKKREPVGVFFTQQRALAKPDTFVYYEG